MANFNMHLNTASIVSGISAAALASVHMIDIKTSFYCFFAGVLGGILPDIDHDNSIPVRIIQFVISNLVAFLVVYNYLGKLKLLDIIVLWLGISIVFEIIFFFFKRLTTHRGIIHSIPMGILFGLITILFLHNILHLNIIVSYYVGIFIFIGYLTHLILDEIYSVDLAGNKIKKSFGSALKLCSNDKRINLLIYFLIVIFFLFLPKKLEFFNLIKRLFDV